MGNGPGPRRPQGVERGSADGDGVGRLAPAHAQGLGDPAGQGVGALGRVIKPFRPHRGDLGEFALNLIGDGQGREKFLSGDVREFGGGQDGPQVVRGMAGLPLGEVAVVEIKVMDEGAVVKRGPVRGGAGAPDEAAGLLVIDRAVGQIPEMKQVRMDRFHRLGFHRGDGAAQGVQDPQF